MPRPRRTAALPVEGLDDPIVNPGDIPADPPPKVRGARPRRAPAKAAGNRGRISARTSTGKIMSEAEMRRKVEEELMMWLSLGAAAWEMRDPECAGVMFAPTRDGGDRLEQLSARITNIVGRNKTVLAYAAKSGIFGDLAAIGTLLYPVGKAVWSAHGPNGHGHGRAELADMGDVDAHYPPYTGAAAR